MIASREKAADPRIEVTEHGPYRVSGDVAIRDTEGNLLRHGGGRRRYAEGQARQKAETGSADDLRETE